MTQKFNPGDVVQWVWWGAIQPAVGVLLEYRDRNTVVMVPASNPGRRAWVDPAELKHWTGEISPQTAAISMYLALGGDPLDIDKHFKGEI